ncbi:EamA family transporter [Mucilaginibacter sp.]|uniref:EamA family transporter n=1 Tax=Mucilaginibacter sp. TaxID=1882438 RepID=UPI00374D1707
MKVFAVIGYLLCFGISDCLWVYPNRKNPVIVSMGVRSIITCLLFVILFWATNNSPVIQANSSNDIITAILISCVSYGGLYFYVKSLKYEQASVIAPVTTILTSLLGLVFSIIFYHEVLTLRIACCLTAAFAGIALSFSKQFKGSSKLKINKGTLLSIAAAMLWAISYTFFKTPVDNLGVIKFSLILELTILAINLIILLTGKHRKALLLLKWGRSTVCLFVIGILIFCGTLLNSYSYKLFPLLYLNVLGKMGVIIPITYCAIFLKEKLSLLQIGGICILVASAILIAL